MRSAQLLVHVLNSVTHMFQNLVLIADNANDPNATSTTLGSGPPIYEVSQHLAPGFLLDMRLILAALYRYSLPELLMPREISRGKVFGHSTATTCIMIPMLP
jgi:hypothetical protein